MRRHCNSASTRSSINLKLPPNLGLLFNQFNDLSSDSINKNPENMMTNCKYYDIDDTQKIKFKPNSFSLFLFDLNACSLNKNFDDLEYLIKTTNQTFDVIAMSPESKVILISILLTLICPTIPLNTHQQTVMLEEPSYILVTTWLINQGRT